MGEPDSIKSSIPFKVSPCSRSFANCDCSTRSTKAALSLERLSISGSYVIAPQDFLPTAHKRSNGLIESGLLPNMRNCCSMRIFPHASGRELSQSLTKNSLSLDTHSTHRVHNHQSSISHTQSSSDLRREIDVSRRINKIDQI